MRIVLVDPSRTVLKVVTRLLEAGEHQVIPFNDAEAALACLKADESVVTLITSAAPLAMTGVELCREARRLATNRRPLYVLMMSSNQERRNVIEALDCGADDFIGKPPEPEELYARLRVAERLHAMQRELIALATTDALTGVLNRRAFFERAADSCARAAAGGRLAAIMFDVDHFKRINDLCGHDVGDSVLRAVAQAAASAGPSVGRLGGEEFAILLDGCSSQQAAAFADRLQAEPVTLESCGGAGMLKVTCSFGVSEWQPNDTIDRLLKRADVALYEAKALGRNRVVVAHSQVHSGHAA